jgi:hypothetical protein
MRTLNLIAVLLFVLAAGAVASYGVLSIRRGRSSRRVLPVLFESAVPLALIAVAILPSALPAVFEMLWGHSPYSTYSYQQANGILVSETWLLSRWWGPCAAVLRASVVAGLVLALWNVFSEGYRPETGIALVLAAVWVTIGLVSGVALMPFFAMTLPVLCSQW